MLNLDLKFFAPHRILKEYQVLCLIDEDPSISQQRLAEAVGLSPAMVNNYVKAFIRQQLIEVGGANNRSFSYHLTPKGSALKRDRFKEYLTEIFHLLASIQNVIDRRLNQLSNLGFRRAVLYRAVETSRIIIESAARNHIEIVGLIDPDPNLQGKRIGLIPIHGADLLKDLDFDIIIVWEKAHTEEALAVCATIENLEPKPRVEALFS